MTQKIIPVVLSGGSGTRMWPLSRSHYPKQFLPLVSEKTMLQETVLRLPALENLSSPMVVCNEDHRFMVAEQLHELGIDPQAILLEPFGRNTAPAVALAALAAPSPEDILLVLPADHVIADHQALAQAIEKAVGLADEGYLATFGIVPTAPETGYGYIHRGSELDSKNGYVVDRFVEKPDLPTAQSYLDDGGYYWNSGMFTFKAGVYLEELEKFNPEILTVCKNASEKGQKDLDFCRIDSQAFEECPSDSIDYAVMEKTDHAVVIPLDAGWNDVGSWSSLWEVSDKDSHGNRLHGDVVTVDTHNSLLHSESRLVASIGLDDIVVIETQDAVMVASKDRVEDVKKIAEHLEAGIRR